jgi:hypothetical protein
MHHDRANDIISFGISNIVNLIKAEQNRNDSIRSVLVL